MTDLSTFLSQHPQLSSDVLRRIELFRASMELEVKQTVEHVQGRKLSPYSGEDLGARLSCEAVHKIEDTVIAFSSKLYEIVAREYVSAEGIKGDLTALFEEMAGAALVESRRLFRNATVGMWFEGVPSLAELRLHKERADKTPYHEIGDYLDPEPISTRVASLVCERVERLRNDATTAAMRLRVEHLKGLGGQNQAVKATPPEAEPPEDSQHPSVPDGKAAAPVAAEIRVLPSIPREALQRIELAEREARERYDRDKTTYFPTHRDFSFLEEFIFRSITRILEYVRIFAEEVLEAHLKEYLESAPLDLLTNEALFQSVADNVWTLTDELWKGYLYVLQLEPASRRARYMMAMAAGTMNEHPELEPWKYPQGEQWAEFLHRMGEAGSEMSRLNERYAATIRKAIGDRIRRYQGEAASRLGMRLGPEAQPEKNHAGDGAPNPAEQSTLEPGSKIARASSGRAGTEAGGGDWDAVEISFLSDERVQIRNGTNTETRNYAEFGFADGRNGRPSQAWLTLRALAQARGTIRDGATMNRDWPKVEKRMQEIRKALRNQFGISADPVPFIAGTGYRACFKIGCSPSFEM